MANKDFIKQRSFEIAWAVFRCSALVRQPKLRVELENAAIGLISPFGYTANLEQLEHLIRLAEAIGELKSINAKVLYRELNGVLEAIRQLEVEINKEKEESSAIEGIFAKLPIVWQEKANSAIVRQQNEKSSAKKELFKSDSEIHNSADKSSANSSAIKEGFGKSSAISSAIAELIKKLGKATTKDLANNLSEISERTIRFYLQKLVEQGIIERKGSISGPGSYYVAKQNPEIPVSELA